MAGSLDIDIAAQVSAEVRNSRGQINSLLDGLMALYDEQQQEEEMRSSRSGRRHHRDARDREWYDERNDEWSDEWNDEWNDGGDAWGDAWDEEWDRLSEERADAELRSQLLERQERAMKDSAARQKLEDEQRSQEFKHQQQQLEMQAQELAEQKRQLEMNVSKHRLQLAAQERHMEEKSAWNAMVTYRNQEHFREEHQQQLLVKQELLAREAKQKAGQEMQRKRQSHAMSSSDSSWGGEGNYAGWDAACDEAWSAQPTRQEVEDFRLR